MKNTEERVFDEKAVELMINPEKWKIVSSFISPEIKPVRNAAYMRWAEKNHDKHEHREILFAISGSFFQTFRGNCYPCVPGSVFLFDSFEVHDRNYPRNVPSMFHLWMSLAKDSVIVSWHCLETGNGIVKSRRFIPGSSETEILLRTWALLGSDMPEYLKRIRICNALSNIFLCIIDKDAETRELNETSEHQKRVVEIVMKHIKDNLSGTNNLDRLAHMAGYSKYHFFRLFKECAGKTLHDYINDCRIARVKAMEKDGFSKKDMSNALGFSCPPAFANWYKKQKLSF